VSGSRTVRRSMFRGKGNDADAPEFLKIPRCSTRRAFSRKSLPHPLCIIWLSVRWPPVQARRVDTLVAYPGRVIREDMTGRQRSGPCGRLVPHPSRSDYPL
jgi:hypothetical protein